MSRYTGFLGAIVGWMLFVVSGGCCHPVVASHPEVKIARDALRSVAFHVDVEFTKHERGLILRAARELHRQTGGQLVVTLVPDLDYTNSDQLPPREDWYLVRLSSLQILMATGRGTELTMGLTHPKNRIVTLVYDRLGAEEQFIHTTMHELLHAFGVDHVAGAAIMVSPTWWDDQKDAPLCMNRLDALAISKALELDPTAFSLACPSKSR